MRETNPSQFAARAATSTSIEPTRMVVAMPSRSTICAPFTQTPHAISDFAAWRSAASMSARMCSR